MGRGALCRASLTCLATLMPTVSQANTSASFQASANIVSGCEVGGTLVTATTTIGQIGTLNYGTRPTLTNGTVTASMVQNPSLQLICTPDVALTMTVDGGLHSATTRNLQASQTVTRLAYRLYRDVALATELVINQPVSISFTGGTAITLPIFGRVTLPGNSLADTYTDTVVVTLNW
jgi:spore coat protein U-like protein